MFNISDNGIITLNRGDSFSLDVFVDIGTPLEPIQYVLKEGDSLYFALTEPNQPFEVALVRREFTKADLNDEGNVTMNFDSYMTEHIMPGTYYYTVKLKTENGEVSTVISKRKFNVID